MIQLKIRTEYSFGQTFAKISTVVQRLKDIGCTSAAIVDNNTWGHVKFYKACNAAGIKPILGVECCVSDDDSFTPRMWFLAKNKAGLNELYKAISSSYKQLVNARTGKVNRLYRADVESLSSDILIFAGDIVDGEWLNSVGAILDLSPSSFILNKKKEQIARQYGLKIVSVSDNYYCYPGDKETFELIGKTSSKTTSQWILEALENQETAQIISESCEQYELSKAPTIYADGDLEKLCRDGIAYRGMSETWTEEYETRLNYELDLIRNKKYESYFIIVSDMVVYAKSLMLVGPSRGSSAGSLVCYLTRITEIDPIPPGLYFERFIDITRFDLPDIDIDFPDDKRHLVFEYMANKYGFDNTAHIGTVSRYKPKSALIAVCKSLNISPKATIGVKIAMVERSSADARASNCLEDTFKTTEAGKIFSKLYPEALKSMEIEGHASHTGVHAAGLLICNDNINNYCVVDNNGIAHIEKYDAEYLNLLKIDVLGLRTLSILSDAAPDVDFYNLKFDDLEVYKIFNEQRLSNIFQFEGVAMRSVSEFMRESYSCLSDIDAVTALARPGPFGGGVTWKWLDRRFGKPYKALHPLVYKHMEDSYGLPIYQEHTISIVRHIGKFDWPDVNAVRKGMSKSLGEEFFHQFRERFIQGATEQGIDEKEAADIWLLISSMGSWQMNKSHTYSYATISYWCAWVKAHRPLEFAAANLRNAKYDGSAVALLREMYNEGIYHVPFDLNLSEVNWSIKDGKLIGGFINLKGIGESKAAKLVEARNAGKLTAKQLETIEKAENIFDDIFPIKTAYGHLYDDPKGNNIDIDKIHLIKDIKEGMSHGMDVVFIGELVHKNPRHANEENEIKKRDGKVETGQLLFIDVRLEDDTSMINGRIGRKDYLRIGVEFSEKVPIGSKLLIRCKMFNGIRFAFITKWKVLNE